jgi:hypothetical protein
MRRNILEQIGLLLPKYEFPRRAASERLALKVQHELYNAISVRKRSTVSATRIDNRENRSVGPYSDRERHNRSKCKARALLKHPQRPFQFVDQTNHASTLYGRSQYYHKTPM